MDFSKLDQNGTVKIPKNIYYCMIDYFLFGNRQPDNEQKIKEALEAKVNALARREEYGRRLSEKHREGTV